jgi:S1-C subfamily serine protease
MKNQQVMFEWYVHSWRSAIVFCLLVVVVVLMGVRPQVRAESTQTTSALPAAVAKAAALNMLAVVHVEAVRQEEAPYPGAGRAGSPCMEHFFNLAKTSGKVHEELKKLGTGIIIDPLGHVLTNRHVVAWAPRTYVVLNVVLTDGRQYPAKLVGTDRRTDMAVIRILTHDLLPYLTFANSDRVKPGESVTAIAHLSPQNPTVSHGTILARHGPGSKAAISYNDYLDKEPLVNLGFSGGPLLNLQGEVIAVNAAVLSPSGTFDGIAFSIPSNVALCAASQLIYGRKQADNCRAGDTLEFFSLFLAKSMNLTDLQGMPAIRPTHGSEVEHSDVESEFVRTDLGHNISGVISKEKTMPESGTYDRRKGSGELSLIGKSEAPDELEKVLIKRCLGVAARTATPEEAGRYHLNLGKTLVVTWLDPAGPLARAGVEVNDIMLEIDGRQINRFDYFEHLVSQARPKQRVTILVLDHRTGRRGYVQVYAP